MMAQHTLEEDFEHYLSYSGRWRETSDTIALLREAYAAAWEPQPRRADVVDKALLGLFGVVFGLIMGVATGLLR